MQSGTPVRECRPRFSLRRRHSHVHDPPDQTPSPPPTHPRIQVKVNLGREPPGFAGRGCR